MDKSPADVYQSVYTDTMSPREQEARVLNKAAMVLQNCKEHWDEDGMPELLDESLRYNQRLWTFFQAELLDAEHCPLPLNMRQDLLNLSVFVDKRTFEIFTAPERGKLDALISINKNLAEGLSGRPS